MHSLLHANFICRLQTHERFTINKPIPFRPHKEQTFRLIPKKYTRTLIQFVTTTRNDPERERKQERQRS